MSAGERNETPSKVGVIKSINFVSLTKGIVVSSHKKKLKKVLIGVFLTSRALLENNLSKYLKMIHWSEANNWFPPQRSFFACLLNSHHCNDHCAILKHKARTAKPPNVIILKFISNNLLIMDCLSVCICEWVRVVNQQINDYAVFYAVLVCSNVCLSFRFIDVEI